MKELTANRLPEIMIKYQINILLNDEPLLIIYFVVTDVLPLHQDWTVEDCIRFQELCVEQQFVGICKDVGKDPLNPNEPLLTLDLIDTSTDEDIYLNKQLVAEGRARLASASS